MDSASWISKRFAIGLVFVLFFVVSTATPGLARTVRVGIGYSIPPYVIRSVDSGLEVDIIRDAFRSVGINVEFVYLPNLRLPIAFAQGSVDCVATNVRYNLSSDSGVAAYSSQTTLIFRNYAVSLQKNGLNITTVADLSDKRVLGFNNAAKYLGPEFAAMAKKNAQYSELADQALQVRMLFSGRVQVVISDNRIFHYWRNGLARSPQADMATLTQPVALHAVFAPAPRHVVFRDNTLRVLFDKGLALLRSCGGYNHILERYEGHRKESTP